MTVLDNMSSRRAGQTGERLRCSLLRDVWREQERDDRGARAASCSSDFSLARMRDDYAATLSGGQRKLLEMARALMAEPTARACSTSRWRA